MLRATCSQPLKLHHFTTRTCRLRVQRSLISRNQLFKPKIMLSFRQSRKARIEEQCLSIRTCLGLILKETSQAAPIPIRSLLKASDTTSSGTKAKGLRWSRISRLNHSQSCPTSAWPWWQIANQTSTRLMRRAFWRSIETRPFRRELGTSLWSTLINLLKETLQRRWSVRTSGTISTK